MTRTLAYPRSTVHTAWPGEVAVTPAVGADGYAATNDYNGQPRSAAVKVGAGEARVITECETRDDVTRLQRPLRA